MSSSTAFSPTRASIDLSALAHNVGVVRRHLAPHCDILAVVKADAYGHGAVPIAQALARLGVRRFGVATVQEGAQLRRAGLSGSIVLLGGLFREQFADLLEHRLTPIIYDARLAEELARALPAGLQPYPIHVKIDTGMSRLGLSPDGALPLLDTPIFQKTLAAEGMMTHLASADSEDPKATRRQLEQFETLLARVRAAGHKIPLIHAANSAAILRHPASHFTLVRPGLMLYGYATLPAGAAPDLRPILTLSTSVAQVRTVRTGDAVSYNAEFTAGRPSRLAVLPIGYADGYRRGFTGRGHVLIHGARAPIAGRVCMDMTIVDVTDIPGVVPGDEAVLIGCQQDLSISAYDLAQWGETIPYEILCGVGSRVSRVYAPMTD